ncbi:hypothetical protein [Actinomycetospora aeridis]|uniref:Uncharacterized protein n=1 Tax=Actinomycetospora aeridis TaxID=3129231 RepID=A0ABU8N378_9PSEU
MDAMSAPTEADVLAWLRRRYTAVSPGNGPRYVFATHVRSAAGFDAMRTADAVVMDTWRSGRWELHGHEVKVSRSDWLRELKDLGKAEAVGRFCDRWWVVVPDASIVKTDELPVDWGLLVVAPTRARTVRQAPKREAEPVSRSFMAALMRAAVRTANAGA